MLELWNCPRQVPEAALRPPGLYCSQLGSGELLKAEPDGAQVRPSSNISGAPEVGNIPKKKPLGIPGLAIMERQDGARDGVEEPEWHQCWVTPIG